MEPYCETKQVKIGENRSGLHGEIGRNRENRSDLPGKNRSELVKTGPKLGQIEPHVPRNTKNSKGGSLEIAVIF